MLHAPGGKSLRGSDRRFAPPHPRHSRLALLTVAGSEFVGRWVAPGVSSRRKPCKGLRPPQAPRER